METHDEPAAQRGDGAGDGGAKKYASKLLPMVSIIFGASAVFHLLRGRWFAAVFYVASALFFTFGRKIDTWPRPKRYAAVAVYLLLALAMVFELLGVVKRF